MKIQEIFEQQINEFVGKAVNYLITECEFISEEDYDDGTLCKIYKNKKTASMIFCLVSKEGEVLPKCDLPYYFAEMRGCLYELVIKGQEDELRAMFKCAGTPKSEEYIKAEARKNGLQYIIEQYTPAYCPLTHY